jgi:two-component system OmpR family sensor kinase
MNVLRSIRWRLQLWYGALIAAVLTGLGVTAYQVESNARLDRVDDELTQMAAALNAEARKVLRPRAPAGAGAPPAPASRGGAGPAALAGFLTAADEARGVYFAVWQKNDQPKFLASPGAPATLPAPVRSEGPVRRRGLYREAFVESNPGDISLVGRSIEPELGDLHRLAWLLTGGGVSMFAMVMATGWWLVTRALRPIEEISRTAAKIATGDLAQRINSRETESELGALAGVLNSTFARLEASFAQQARFTADAAHELRTPVTVVLTHVQNALAEGGLSEEQREAFEACQRAAQRMRRLIESLLQLARLDAGQDSLHVDTIDLSVVADECLALIRPLATGRRITLQKELAAAECRGDPGRLGQVITNLVGNAIHHGREGGEVSVVTTTEGNDAVLIVADDGPGIGAEHAAHIFERFYRVDKARTGTAGRTGLGLAISRAIIDAHGGTIEVRSVVGAGATFTVRVPRG